MTKALIAFMLMIAVIAAVGCQGGPPEPSGDNPGEARERPGAGRTDGKDFSDR